MTKKRRAQQRAEMWMIRKDDGDFLCKNKEKKKLTLIRVELSEAQQISDIRQIVCSC